MDAAGFEMLNMIRQHYPSVQSLLMNNDTFESFKEFSVDNKYRKKELPFLNREERLLYQHITENSKRLEQERISQ
ncbi:Wadjet anti-phage system protein JetD domain-containing protein, partial [Enterobacter hormaechei]